MHMQRRWQRTTANLNAVFLNINGYTVNKRHAVIKETNSSYSGVNYPFCILPFFFFFFVLSHCGNLSKATWFMIWFINHLVKVECECFCVNQLTKHFWQILQRFWKPLFFSFLHVYVYECQSPKKYEKNCVNMIIIQLKVIHRYCNIS